MLDPFQKLVSHGVTPEYSTQDQVAQLYIEYSATPNPEMMEFFYERFETYWQCACGSQNEPRQRFCGRCGVSHEWLALHCSPIYLAARIIKRRGNELVRWYDADGTRVSTPWPQGPPVELEPFNLRATARKLANSAEQTTTAPVQDHTQRYTPPREDLATEDEARQDQVVRGRESVVRETAERLAQERRERERLEREQEAQRLAEEEADRARLAAQRRAEQEAIEARVAAEAEDEARRRQAEREALEAAELERRQRRDEQRAEREQAKQARQAEQARAREAEREALRAEQARLDAEREEDDASDVPLVGWGDHLKQIARGEYDATEKRPHYEEARKQTERGAAAKRPTAEGGEYKVRSGDVIATIVAGLLLLLLLLIVINPRQGDDTELPGDTSAPRSAVEMHAQAEPHPAFVLRNL